MMKTLIRLLMAFLSGLLFNSCFTTPMSENNDIALDAISVAKMELSKRGINVDNYIFRVESPDSESLRDIMQKKSPQGIISEVIGNKLFVCVVANKGRETLGGVIAVFLNKELNEVYCIYRGK